MRRLVLACALALSVLSSATPAFAESFQSGSLKVDVYGAAGKPALVFIPGLTCGPWEWSREIARYAPAYRIYALTLPGFDGQPGAKTPLVTTVEADFWNLLETRQIKNPTLIGHSLGGTLAISLAEQHPDRLRAVIAVDGLPIFPGMDFMSEAQRNTMAAQTAAMMAATPQAQFAESQKRTLPYLVTSPKDVDAIANAAAKTDPLVAAEWAKEDLLADFRPQLKNAAVPILEIAPFDPKLDPFGPAKFADAAAKQRYYESLFAGAPQAKVHVIQPSRHFIMYDQPAALDAALDAALR